MSSLEYRNRVLRGQRIFAANGVHFVSSAKTENRTEFHYEVSSESKDKLYKVDLFFEPALARGEHWDELALARCQCRDWQANKTRLDQYLAEGIDPSWPPAFLVVLGEYIPICKHVVAALNEQGWHFNE